MPAIDRLNADPRVAGIVVAQPFEDVAARPAPRRAHRSGEGRRRRHADERRRLARGEPAFVPATALAVIAIIEEYEVPVAGLRAVIVGRSAVVGRPVVSLLLARDATVVVCHTRTRDLAAETQRADLILVAAAGVPGLVPRRDGHRPARSSSTAASTRRRPGSSATSPSTRSRRWRRRSRPVPGGIGPVTPMMVLRQLVEAAERRASAAA